MTGCSYGADCSLVDGLGRVGLVGRCCLREPVGYVRRLFECCRIILLKPGVWRPASGWAGCLRAGGLDAQTCLYSSAFWRRDAVALLRRPSARSARPTRIGWGFDVGVLLLSLIHISEPTR